MKLSILISGTGGQGIIFAGEILSKAFFKAGYNVINTHSYGAEARGGACKSELLVSDEEIYDLSLTEADILIAMCTPAYGRYIPQAKHRTIVILESSVVEDLKKTGVKLREDVETIAIPAKRLAENLGDVIVANMILIGALVKKTGLIDLEVMKSVVEEGIRPTARKINLRALENGFSSIN